MSMPGRRLYWRYFFMFILGFSSFSSSCCVVILELGGEVGVGALLLHHRRASHLLHPLSLDDDDSLYV